MSADIDNDGSAEVVVHTFPHYRQSAPVLIYKVSTEGVIARVTEGLAPGPVQEISGEYLDSHELGSGVDFALASESGKTDRKDALVRLALANFGGVVAYRDFYHADERKGPAYYVDMANAELPPNASNCCSFEFSRVRQIAAGRVREDPSRNHVAAWVGDELYVYLIKRISDQGRLDKRLWIVKIPDAFKGFLPDKGLTYSTPSGTAVLTLQIEPAP